MPVLYYYIPRATTMYEIIAYYKGGSDITLNIIKPIPSTTKFDINVKVLRKLLSLSYILFIYLLFAF